MSDQPRFDYLLEQPFHWWEQDPRRNWETQQGSIPQGGTTLPAVFSIIWTGYTSIAISWSNILPGCCGTLTMFQYRTPVRNNTPQILTYTFKDQSGNVIDTTPYVSVTLQVKFQGQLFSTLSANFVYPRNLGMVQCTPVILSMVGIWDFQFYLTDGGNNRVFGIPCQVTVVPNVEDLALSQLPVY